MPPVYNSPINSFQYGELSPKFAARTDTEQWQKGAAKIENMIVLPTGGVTRRPGSVYVDQVESSTTAGSSGVSGARLIEFVFSKTESYVFLIKIIQSTGSLTIAPYATVGDNLGIAATSTTLTADVSWTQAQLDEIQYVQKGDIVFCTQKDHPIFIIYRTAANTFSADYYLNYNSRQTEVLVNNFLNRPYRDVNISRVTLTPSAATVGTGRTLTTGPSTAITGAASNGVPNLIRITAVAHGFFTGDRVFISGITGTTEANGTWTVTTITANTFDLQGSVFAHAYIANGTVWPAIFDSLMVDAAGITENNTYFKITQTTTAVFKITSVTDVAHATGDVIIAFDAAVSSDNWRESSWSWYRGWPACVGIFENRLIFASITNEPDKYWGSLLNNFFHFMAERDVAGVGFTGTAVETDPFSFVPSAKEINTIQWIQGGRTLAVGTQGQEFVAFGTAERILSASAITMQDHTSIGSSRVQALRVGSSTVFVSRDGNSIYQHDFANLQQSYVAESLNSISDQIHNQTALDWLSTDAISGVYFDISNLRMSEIKWQGSRKTIWAKAGGYLAGITFDPSVKCQGWHRHIFGGSGVTDAEGNIVPPLLISLAVIPSQDGFKDNLWVLVQRTVNSKLQYMLEIIGPDYCFLNLDSYSDLLGGSYQVPYFMDSAKLTTNTTAAATATATHLIGEEVEVLADGAYHPPVTVAAGGTVTLTREANQIVVGLKYTPRIKLFPIDAGSAIGSAIGLMTRINQMTVRFWNTLHAVIKGQEGSTETPNFRPGSTGMGEATPVYSGDKRIDVPMSPERAAQIEIYSDRPLPLTVLGISMKGQTYG